MQKISAVIIAKNEESKIEETLKSVSFADEIIVIDDESTDKTVTIAKKYTDKIYSHKSKGYVEAVRNFALSKATGDWILLLDADETVPKSLAEKLQEIIKDDTVEYCKIPRKNIIFGKWIQYSKGWWPDYQLRFFRKGKVVWPEKIHAQPEVTGKGIILPPSEDYALRHINYESISQFMEKLERYTTQEALEKGENKNLENAFKMPTKEFVSRFFAQEGYKDGMHGLMLSLLEALSQEVLFAKQWEKTGFSDVEQASFLKKNYEAMQKSALEIEYWYLTTLINEATNPLVKAKLQLNRKKVTRKLAHK